MTGLWTSGYARLAVLTALAALVLALAAGASLETAAHFSNAASGVVVGKLGTATVTPAELMAYVAHES